MRYLAVVLSASVAALSSGVAFAAAEHGGHEPHWSYTGGDTGPESWGKLKPEFATCSAGKEQSPININKALSANLQKIEFSYKDSPLEVVNNGHTIQANYQAGSTITVNGKTFELAQFHFHAPSEHTVEGKAYPMEAHFVHKNAQGELAVVGVFLEKGETNAALTPVWNNMPKEANHNAKLEQAFNAKNLLPQEAAYYHYKGSLTTPPCAESVDWYVLKNPVKMSDEQVKAFNSVIKANARPVQPSNRRFILADDGN